jgi:hypothetical protein
MSHLPGLGRCIVLGATRDRRHRFQAGCGALAAVLVIVAAALALPVGQAHASAPASAREHTVKASAIPALAVLNRPGNCRGSLP